MNGNPCRSVNLLSHHLQIGDHSVGAHYIPCCSPHHVQGRGGLHSCRANIVFCHKKWQHIFAEINLITVSPPVIPLRCCNKHFFVCFCSCSASRSSLTWHFTKQPFWSSMIRTTKRPSQMAPPCGKHREKTLHETMKIDSFRGVCLVLCETLC